MRQEDIESMADELAHLRRERDLLKERLKAALDNFGGQFTDDLLDQKNKLIIALATERDELAAHCERLRDAVQDARFPLPEENQPQWSGEGLPPVGTVCEFTSHDYHEWIKCEVIHEQSGFVVVVLDPDVFEIRVEVTHRPEHFRPVRTERERFIYSVIDLFGLNAGEDQRFESMAGQIYDAGARFTEDK